LSLKLEWRASSHKEVVYDIDIAVDSATISVSGDRTARLWDSKGQPLWVSTFEDDLTCVKFAPSSNFAACGSLDHCVYILDTKSGQQLRQWKAHDDPVYTVSFGRSDVELYTGSDKIVKKWINDPSDAYVADQGWYFAFSFDEHTVSSIPFKRIALIIALSPSLLVLILLRTASSAVPQLLTNLIFCSPAVAIAQCI
jgi:WD40 repeat protein